ncbi:MAG: acyl-CoA dehydrogenase family protein, partial [Acidobacteriota bacterium]
MSMAVSAERQAIVQTIREFADAEIRPHVMEWDEAQHFPVEVFRQLGELGFLGVLFPEEYGGSGLTYGDYAAIVEELSAVDASIALSLAAHNSLGSNHIFQFGTEAQRRRYMPKLTSGEWLAAWGLTEAEAGSDAAGTRTTAVRDGNDWVLNGSKNFITNASVGKVAVLMAVSEKSAGRHGISAFIVELDNPGIRVGKKENKLGMRASDTCTLVMEDCRVPAENLLGKEGSGFIDSMKILDGGRISIAALSIGIARGAYEASLKYAKERRQFGRPIAEFEAIQFFLADMATEIDASRLLTIRAAAAKDAGEEVTRFSAQAKLYAS